ncbi:MAG: hypothetical protein JJU03_10355 [Idiomarina sp.]|nr:hypothetical protein [Idiomarina sp.]
MKKPFQDIVNNARENTEDTMCLWDAAAKLGVLIQRDGTIFAAMDYDVEADIIARVQQSASLQGRKGYGYCMYLHAMAALGPTLLLSPDTTGLTKSALKLWERFFEADELCKRSMYGTPAYRPCMDETFDEGVWLTNPHLLDSEWQAYEALGELQQRIETGAVLPHLSNWGFALPDNHRLAFQKTIRPIEFTKLQQRVIYDYLTLAFQLEKTGYMIPMQLPKRTQTKLVE